MTGPASGSATATVVANMGLLWLADLFGVPVASVQELAWATTLGIAGAFAWQFITARKNREAAIAKGARGSDVPKIDLTTLGYAMLGAPLASGLLIWAIHAMGGVPTSYTSSGLYMAAGAAGPEYVTMALSVVMRFLSGLTGGNKP